MGHGPLSLLAIGGADVMRIAEPSAAPDALAQGFKALTQGTRDGGQRRGVRRVAA